MIRLISFASIVALCLSRMSTVVSAQTAIFSAETGVSTSSPCPSFCGGAGGAFDSDFDGGIGLTMSSSSLNNVDGSGQALSELNGQMELPVLKVDAFSHEQALPQRSSRVGAQAFGLQGFYAAGSSYSLDINLTGIANDVPEPSPNVFNEDGSVVAHVMIIRDNDPNSDISFTSHYPTMKFELIPGSDLEILADSVNVAGQATLVIPPDNTVHNVSTTLTAADLNFNDLIYVWTDLNASGTRGGFGDAFSTLTMQFQNSQGLSHTPHPPVPEPSALALGLLSVCPLLLHRRGQLRSALSC